MKIIYAGLRNNYYNPKRGVSFEYRTFYAALAAMQGMTVMELPFDRIIEVGKKKFNEEALALAEKEKPDLFFVFTYSDEFYPATLEAIKKITTSVAWYTDDSWRFYNYSRRWYPHFAWNVTTYSWIPGLARQLGITNVIRSQWAANPRVWHPVDLKKDIGVSFIGQRNPERAKVIAALRKAGIEVFVRGWGWPEGHVSQEELVHLISRSKINLNINSQPSIWDLRSLGRIFLRPTSMGFLPDFRLRQNFQSWRHISDRQIKARPFELAACNAFVISGFADDLGAFYRENEEMVFYRTTEELIGKITEYLPKDAECERIAKAGYDRTLRDHTYEKRFKEIFQHIGMF